MRTGLLVSSFLLLLPACGGDEPAEEPTPIVYYDANAADAAARQAEEDAADAAATEEHRRGRGAAKSLAFEAIEVTPDVVTVEGTLYAEATLTAGASSFADIDYTWSVNGRTIQGITKGELSASAGRFKKGDAVTVQAEAIDEKGNMATIESKVVIIANSTPVILNDISRRVGIDGLVMKAEDADGDPIEFSVVSGPPGVSIDRRGAVQVEQVNLDEDFEGEVVIAATDPDGARAEFHVPVSINAAVEEVVGERTTSKEVYSHQMTEEEYEKANLEGAERVMEMNEKEFDEYWADQERREEEGRKKKDGGK